MRRAKNYTSRHGELSTLAARLHSLFKVSTCWTTRGVRGNNRGSPSPYCSHGKQTTPRPLARGRGMSEAVGGGGRKATFASPFVRVQITVPFQVLNRD